jgi:predicted Kef-type K+ transport protein
MMILLTLLEILKTCGWIDRLVRMLTPILKCLGLSQRVGILWMAGAIFGLVYAAAVIVEEAKQKNLSKEELEGLQLSIGIHHSVIEDPAIFIALGLSPFWMLVPRLIAAMVFVRLFSLWHHMKTA